MSRGGLNMKKAIFFDIDGTLIDCINGHIDLSHQVKQAIRRLQQEGHYAFIATGRPYAFLSEAILSFGFDGYILTNGAQVMIGNETIYKEPLDPTFVKNATAEFEQRQIQYMLQSDCYSYMKDECKEYYQFFDSIGISRNYLVSDYQLEDIQTQKIECFVPMMKPWNIVYHSLNKILNMIMFRVLVIAYLNFIQRKTQKRQVS